MSDIDDLIHDLKHLDLDSNDYLGWLAIDYATNILEKSNTAIELLEMASDDVRATLEAALAAHKVQQRTTLEAKRETALTEFFRKK